MRYFVIANMIKETPAIYLMIASKTISMQVCWRCFFIPTSNLRLMKECLRRHIMESDTAKIGFRYSTSTDVKQSYGHLVPFCFIRTGIICLVLLPDCLFKFPSAVMINYHYFNKHIIFDYIIRFMK